MVFLQRPAGAALGGEKVAVAGLALLDTLDVGRELVRRLHKIVAALGGPAVEIGLERAAHLLGQGVQQLFAGKRLHLVIGALDLAAVVLDGRGQIAGQDLGAVVVEGDGGVLFGIAGDLQHVPPDDAEGMGDDCHLMAVLLDILGQGIAHEAPAADIAHAGQIGKKVVAHDVSPISIMRKV